MRADDPYVPASCPLCRGPLVEIRLPIEHRQLEMRSCSRCDVRFWRDGEDDVELADVLGREPARQPALR